jgi:hypothetical protein
MKPEPCEALSTDETKELHLEVVRHLSGRPLFLTARRFIKICRWIEQGESISDACRMELVTYQGFRKHVKRNPKYQRRLREAEETREEFLREFHIANIRKHAPKNVLASLWWLERRYPNQFALRNVVRTEGAAEQPIGDKIDEEQLRRYAALMQDFAREESSATLTKSAVLPSDSTQLDENLKPDETCQLQPNE